MKSTAKILPIFIFLAFFMFLHFASAQEINNFQIEAKIENSKSIVSYQIETDLQQISLNLPADTQIISSSLSYTLKDNILTTDIENKSLDLEYVTSKFIENNKYFTADFKIPETKNLTVRLILPESSTLDKAYPTADLTSDGKHIILEWQVQNTKSFPVFISYNEKGNSLLWALIVFVIVIAIAAFFLIKRKPTPKIKTKPVKELHLLESESAVIKALKEAKGELWQKQIQLKTNFSKAKLSRVIRNLEARNLVKRIPLGNTNKIKLK